MIRLFRRDETNFEHNEWVLTDTSKCLITEVTNGNFELDFEYPVQDRKGLSKYLITGNIIKCNVGDSRGEQLFRIRKSSGDKIKTIYAQSKLIADLSANRIKAMTIIGKTRKEAIQMVLNAALDSHDYVVGNKDKNSNKNFIVKIEEGSVLNALVGSKNSILSTYGGEYIIDNNTIDIVDHRGTDRGFTIAYGKNIKGIKATEDDIDLATVIIPKMGELRLPEYVVESPNVNKYEKRYFKELDVKGLKIWNGEGEKKEDEITDQEAYVKMKEAAKLLFTKNHIDLINFTYELDLAILSKTEEYKSKGYYLMEDIFLGDIVKVEHEILNIDLFGKVNKAVYNVLMDRYESVTIGFKKQGITDIINDTIRSIQFTKQEILLRVSNVQNNMYAQMKILETGIYEDIENTEKGLSTQIVKTAEGITENIENIEAGLEMNIRKTAEGINANVKDLKDNMEADLSLQTNKIDAVVSEGEDSGSWELDKEAFKVAFSGSTSDRVQIDRYGIIAENSTGGYTRLGSKGLLHIKDEDSTHGKAYHYLTATGSITIDCDNGDEDYTEGSDSLPSDFDGIDDDDIAISVSIKKVYKNGSYIPFWFGAYGSVEGGEVVIQAMSAWMPWEGGKVKNGKIIISWTAIA